MMVKIITILAVFMGVLYNPSQAAPMEDPHAEHRRMAQEAAAMKGSETKVNLPDLELLDSEGNQQNLMKLLSSNKVVVVDFIFTTCTTICPTLTAIMSATKQQLSTSEREEILFVSISVDPKNDTPKKMYEYSQRFNARDHWIWLTGNPADISRVLRAFGVPAYGRPENHPPTIVVGSFSQNRWSRWIGMTKPKALAAAARTLLSTDFSMEKDAHVHQ